MKDTQRNAFMIYKDNRVLFDAQTDEAAGKLIKAVFAYICDGEDLKTDDGMINMAYQVLRNAFDRDAEKYQATCERNRENQRRRWERKKEESADRPGSLGYVSIVQEEDPSDIGEVASAYDSIRAYTDHTDRDNKPDNNPNNKPESKTDTDAPVRVLVSPAVVEEEQPVRVLHIQEPQQEEERVRVLCSSEVEVEEEDPYTPRELAQICQRERIPLNVYGIAAFVKAMRASSWEVSGRPIENIVAVLIDYSRQAARAYTLDLSKTIIANC